MTALTVLANSECPHCVQAVDLLTDLAVHEGIPIAAIDVAHHPEQAARWDAESSPFLVFAAPGRADATYAGMPDAEAFHRLAAPP